LAIESCFLINSISISFFAASANVEFSFEFSSNSNAEFSFGRIWKKVLEIAAAQ
jgi:hypothetical protein